jgi:hypothetical protein
MDACWRGGDEMNIIELAKQVGFQTDNAGVWVDDSYIEDQLEALCKLAVARERDAIMKSIEELRPVEDPLLQNKPAAFWIENFRQIVYTRGEA